VVGLTTGLPALVPTARPSSLQPQPTEEPLVTLKGLPAANTTVTLKGLPAASTAGYSR